MSKTIDQIADEVHNLAKQKGWHNFDEDESQFIARAVANEHGEVSELWEAYRNGTLHKLCDKYQEMIQAGIEPLTSLEEELADMVIRALDTARRLKVDIARAIELKHQFNASRPYRHGGKAA